MQVKCGSCGASQEIINTQNCNFCGSIINTNSEIPNKSEIVFDKNDTKITIYDKSLEVETTNDNYRILLKNITNITTQLNNQSKYLHLFFLFFALIFLIISIYSNLIPHKIYVESAELVHLTGSGIDMISEVSIGGFIFSIIVPIGPLFLISFFLKNRYNKFNQKTKSNSHIISLYIKGIEKPKQIVIGSIEDNKETFMKLLKIIENNKMNE